MAADPDNYDETLEELQRQTEDELWKSDDDDSDDRSPDNDD